MGYLVVGGSRRVASTLHHTKIRSLVSLAPTAVLRGIRLVSSTCIIILPRAFRWCTLETMMLQHKKSYLKQFCNYLQATENFIESANQLNDPIR